MVWEVGYGFVTGYLHSGEYIRHFFPDNREEIKSIWTGKCWILEKNERWIRGAYYRRDRCVFSFRNPELKIELSAKAISRWLWIQMLGERAVYTDGTGRARDATTDAVRFAATELWGCDAGLAVRVGNELRFVDGVRKDLPVGGVEPDERVDFLRVSETEYSIKVGSPERYFLLDTAKWTCREV